MSEEFGGDHGAPSVFSEVGVFLPVGLHEDAVDGVVCGDSAAMRAGSNRRLMKVPLLMVVERPSGLQLRRSPSVQPQALVFHSTEFHETIWNFHKSTLFHETIHTCRIEHCMVNFP